MFISQPFEELHGWNLEFLLTTHKYSYGAYFGTILAILDFSKRLYLNCLKSYGAKIWDLSYIPPNVLLGPILKLNWACFIANFCYWRGGQRPKKGPKGPGGPKGPQPSAGGRRRGVEHPKLLVSIPGIYQISGIHPITCVDVIHVIPSVYPIHPLFSIFFASI